MSAPPPVRTPDGLALLEWVKDRQRSLSEDSTYDRGAIAAYQRVWQQLRDQLPYVEAGALLLVGMASTYPNADRLMGYVTDREVPTETAA